MSSFQKFNEAFWSLLQPWSMIWMSLTYLPGATLRLYRTSGVRALFSWRRVQSAWFNDFWSWWGPRIREGRGPRVIALLEGRVTQGQVCENAVTEPVGGVVLDIGPGGGYWVDLYARTRMPVKSGDGEEARSGQVIRKVYGVEPSAELWPSLRERVGKAGLDSVYEILPVGIEGISKTPTDNATPIEKGSIDCIVSLLCLCSIPEPEKNIKELYGYLKKGGRWYLYEHVVHDYWPMRLYQAFVNIFWPYAYGNCHLCENTRHSLENAGKWAKVDLVQPPEEQWHFTVPHIFGTLTK